MQVWEKNPLEEKNCIVTEMVELVSGPSMSLVSLSQSVSVSSAAHFFVLIFLHRHVIVARLGFALWSISVLLSAIRNTPLSLSSLAEKHPLLRKQLLCVSVCVRAYLRVCYLV